MKSKKMLLPILILVVAVFAMSVYSVVSSIAMKPTITEQEFPFSITYELDGEVITIEDVYVARYEYNDGYTNTQVRIYTGKIASMEQNGDNTYIFYDNASGSLRLDTHFYADYLMGDPEYEYFDDEVYAPQLLYYDAVGYEYTDEETLLEQGAKLISWEYPTPIENTLVYSHISIFDRHVLLPTMLIGALALLAIAIWVKKEKTSANETIDLISVITHFLLGIIAAPVFAAIAWVLDIMGNNRNIWNQMLYFTPALTILGVALSIALRRKGCSKTALSIQFVGPAAFLLIMVALSFVM